MEKTAIIITLVLSLLGLPSCSKKEQETVSPQNTTSISMKSLEGEWILKNVLQGDILNMPCTILSGEKPNVINLTLKVNEKGELSANGRSAINMYFGEIQLKSMAATNQFFDVKKILLGSTLMAASEELMQCENRFFAIFNNAQYLHLEGDLLRIGVKGDNKNPEDAGSWLIFEKKK